jgi:hypothetical protein
MFKTSRCRLWGCFGRSQNEGAIVTRSQLPSEMGAAKAQIGNEEDDLAAIRSWREQRNTSSALVIINVEPKLQRIDEDDENSLSLPPPIEEIEEVPPSSPRNLSLSKETIDDIARTVEPCSHVSGGFPTFTPEEDEWRQQHALLKEAYLSSSSASSGSTVEDPVLRRSSVVLDESFDTSPDGPVDLDKFEDRVPTTGTGLWGCSTYLFFHYPFQRRLGRIQGLRFTGLEEHGSRWSAQFIGRIGCHGSGH